MSRYGIRCRLASRIYSQGGHLEHSSLLEVLDLGVIRLPYERNQYSFTFNGRTRT